MNAMPIVARTKVTIFAFLSGRKAIRLVSAPSTKPNATATRQRRQIGHPHLHVQHPGDEAREHEQLAVSEIDHAGRLVHHHDTEGDQGVKRPSSGR